MSSNKELAAKLIQPLPNSPLFSPVRLKHGIEIDLQGFYFGLANDTFKEIYLSLEEKVRSIKAAETLCTIDPQLRPLASCLSERLQMAHLVTRYHNPRLIRRSVNEPTGNVVILDTVQKEPDLYSETVYSLKEGGLNPQAVVSLVGEYNLEEIEGSLITFFPVIETKYILCNPLLKSTH